MSILLSQYIKKQTEMPNIGPLPFMVKREGARFYPFTAPAVMPLTMYFWQER